MKVFLDCGNYFGDNINLGDEAVLRGLSRGFARHLPQAEFHVATFAPELIRRNSPSFAPYLLAHRGEHYSASFARTIADSDAAGVILAGAFSDAFEEHVLGLLETLDLAASRGKPTFLLSAGFERVTSRRLLERAREVLPKVDWICCREPLYGPTLLREWGVPLSRILVTGDSAVEEAYGAARPSLGGDLGFSARVAPYSGLTRDGLHRIGSLLAKFAAANGCEIVPVPISLQGPSDLASLAAYGAPSARHLNFADPRVLYSRIARCRVLVSATYHAAVFALSQGIPVVAIALSPHYQVKLHGLASLFPQATVVLEPHKDSRRRLIHEVERLWSEAPGLSSDMLETARILSAVHASAMERITHSLVASHSLVGSGELLSAQF